jgi:hypothetical protein
MLTGAAAALSLIGAAGAQAEIIYMTEEPQIVATAPGYIYDQQATIVEPAYRVVPRDYVLVAPEPGYAAEPRVPPRASRVAPRGNGIVTTGYSTTRTCMVDAFGFERCF